MRCFLEGALLALSVCAAACGGVSNSGQGLDDSGTPKDSTASLCP